MVPSMLKKMKVKSHRQAQVMVFILILGVARLLLEYARLSWSSPSVGKMRIAYEPMLAGTSDRFSEVKEHCTVVASEASSYPLDGSWWFPREVSLRFSGEWEQKGSVPLLSLHSRKEDNILKVASLLLISNSSDFQAERKTKVANLTASLCLHISNSKTWIDSENQPGITDLCIYFQGIYAETNSGDQKLCMLGRAKMALRHSNVSVRSEWSGPSLVEDDKILLHLQIPPSSGLTGGKIVGRLASFHVSDHPMFFDPVDVNFPLVYSPPYKFNTDSMVESACSAEVHENKFTDLELYKGKTQCCELIRSILEYWTLEGIPNWQCKGPVEYCNRIGPFSNQEGFSNCGIIIRSFQCFEFDENSDINISATIGVVPEVDNTGKSGLGPIREDQNTMWIQGKWRKASPGKICMVGCFASTPTPACDFLVCLYIPKSLSLKQRNMVVGFISSIHRESKAFYPLSFEHPIQPRISLPYGLYGEMSYHYAKDNITESVLERKNLKSLDNLIRWRLGRRSFSAFNHRFEWRQSCLLKQEKISQEERPFLKVAAQLKLDGIFPTLLKLSVEGVYDPQGGQMNLVGCRDIRDQREILHSNTSIDVEDGLDCQIELKLQYPPTNFKLLIDRSVKVSIRSNRTESDSLYFKPVQFHTAQILYIGETAEAIPHRILEPVLKILSLYLATVCIASQLVYIRHNAQAPAYISLLMVDTQALGFGISLTTGIDHFYFASSDSSSKEGHYTCSMEENLSSLFDVLINAMLLVAFTFTVRLFYTVWQSRLRLSKVPSEKWVLLWCGVMYAIGFVIEICIGISKPYCNTITRFGGRAHVKMHWKEVVRPYVGLFQDFFLLPQVLWISEWKYNGEPVRKFYYLGTTALCFLPQIYCYLYNPHSQNENVRFGSIAAVVSAAIV
ncbi:hypothetical protein SUGI_0366610 [Cryptomeria japonica]|uniref:uncharacterized protein LOC131057025 n=1 Tax=Cryptomeria japonica TaxID=3369 RepID=UPI002408ACD7|nr:uncharacterized protein LOC131057025 [Cryptomeria japonica]GLJ20198.1 hypothetical protein SUGI_0366610 [Cryptomeria japonica]